eukprot:TRINITY_DN342_c0_g1_i1.p1 TRINITY_DN342_c0_g1~~TRINITY_DN342_c0_g1_i1.p1  ORF type:complete len:309 (-),score=22.48 TRINITY_DN342_c0_g1_i1:333-1157(-)
MRTLKSTNPQTDLDSKAKQRYLNDSLDAQDIASIINIMTSLYHKGEVLLRNKSYAEAYIAKKEFLMFFEKKLDKHNWYVPYTFQQSISALERMKTTIEHQLPSILSHIGMKKATQNDYCSSQQSTYMHDYSPIASTTRNPKRKSPRKKEEAEDLPELERVKSAGDSLRRVLYPTKLIEEFVSNTEHNTRNSIETCGVLCGILGTNSKKKPPYMVTRIFIPEQKGTSNMCITRNYEEIYDYVTSNDLLVLGWIHTHPDYVPFLLLHNIDMLFELC